MKKFLEYELKAKDYIILALLVAMLIITAVLTRETKIAKPSERLETTLSEVIEASERIDDFQYLWLKPEVYENWTIISWSNRVFGYREVEDGIEIIIGNHDGTDYATSFIFSAENPEIIDMQLSSGNITLESSELALKFQRYSRSFIIDSNGNAWEY